MAYCSYNILRRIPKISSQNPSKPKCKKEEKKKDEYFKSELTVSFLHTPLVTTLKKRQSCFGIKQRIFHSVGELRGTYH
jgi:hypothetical protein